MSSIKSAIASAATYLNAHPKLQGLLYIARDCIEGGLAAVVALNLAFPSSVSGAQAEGITAVTALSGAAIAVGRRELLPYLQSLLGL